MCTTEMLQVQHIVSIDNQQEAERYLKDFFGDNQGRFLLKSHTNIYGDIPYQYAHDDHIVGRTLLLDSLVENHYFTQ